MILRGLNRTNNQYEFIAKMNANEALLQKHMQVWLYCKDGCQYGFIAKMDASTVSLQRQVPMWLCSRDVCRWMLARASLQG